MNHDAFEHDAGPYVLGALAPADRRAFEEHLRSCEACTAAVRELAGVPGLLAQVDPASLDSPVPPEDPPDVLLPALLVEVRRARRRRRLWSAAGAVTAGVLAVTGVGLLREASPPTGPPEQAQDAAPSPTPEAPVDAPVATRTMRPLGQSAVTARLGMEEVAWGTRLHLECSYRPTGRSYSQEPPSAYALVVHTRDGRREQVATWRALPGRRVSVDAATATAPRQIASVDVRVAHGRPLLELTS